MRQLMTPQEDAVIEEEAASKQVSRPAEPHSPPSMFIPPEELEEEPLDATPFPAPPVPTPTRRLYLMVLADFGLAFTWLCKFAVATPYFQHTLKASKFLSHLVWIMGPLSGLIVAPVVGVLSDRCTWSFGRRRPFILGGMLACILGMNIFANVTALTFGYLGAARWLAFFAFGVLDFSTNAIMFPSRALLGDLLPADEQHAVQSAAAVVASAAEICGGIYIYTWKDPVTHVSKVFAVASVLLALTCSVSLFVCHEEPLRPGNIVSAREANGIEMTRLEESAEFVDDGDALTHDSSRDDQTNGCYHDEEAGLDEYRASENSEISEHDEEIENRLSMAPAEDEDGTTRSAEPLGGTRTTTADVMGLSVWRELVMTLRSAIVNFPKPLIRVGVVYGLAWFVWFASLPFYSQWLGVDVLKGNPNASPGTPEAANYQLGVSIFSIANVMKAAMAIVFSAFYPRIIKWVGSVGERVVFGVSFLGFSAVLFSHAGTNNIAVAATVIALGAVPFIATQTIPIAIVVQRFPDNLASNLGVLNLFCVVPQLIDTLYTGKIAEIASESTVLRVAAVWGFATGIAALLFL